MGKIVLVLGGSGLFGSHAVKAFAVAGWQVRKYQRGTDMNAAAKGVDLIVNGLNPPMYHDWDRIIPAITGQAIAAAEVSGARFWCPAMSMFTGVRRGRGGRRRRKFRPHARGRSGGRVKLHTRPQACAGCR